MDEWMNIWTGLMPDIAARLVAGWLAGLMSR